MSVIAGRAKAPGSRLAGAAALAGLVWLLAALVSGCGGSKQGLGQGLDLSQSSWKPGQPSLAASSEYLAVADRALALAQNRQAARDADLARREAERIAARKNARTEALRKFREAKRQAKARYEAALRRAKELRAKRAAELARRKAELERRRRELERKRRIAPGEECQLPEVRRQFDCKPGKLGEN